MKNIFGEFGFGDIFPFLLMLIFTILAYYVTLTTAVITTKGKIVGILLFFVFSLAASIVESAVGVPALSAFDDASTSITYLYYQKTLFAIFQIITFAFIGLQVLKRQDL